MNKLRLIFLFFLVLMLLPILRYYDLSLERDRFLSASEIRSKVTEVSFLPRLKIVDRNGNQLALDILRETLLFKNEIDKNIVLQLAIEENVAIFLNANRRLWFENDIDITFLEKAKNACDCNPIQEMRSRRYYPYGSITSTVVGFSGTDGGLEGVERVYNTELSEIEFSRSFIQPHACF